MVAWSERLARDPRFSRLILVGHSEGALIASLAAPRTPAEELIAIAGSGQPIDRVLREQLRGRLPPAQLRQADSVLASLKAGETRGDIPPALANLLRPSVQPYLISLFREDPARAFGRLRIPTLIVQGRNDIQVGVADAEALQRAKPDSQLVLIDGMNHILRIAPSTGLQQLSAYNDRTCRWPGNWSRRSAASSCAAQRRKKAAEPLQKSLPAPTSSESRPVKAAGQRMSDDR